MGKKTSPHQEFDSSVESVPASLRVASVILDEMIRSGVRNVVVCPGSRSAPLALACAEAARLGRLTMHIRTDERTAAFLALGLADSTKLPVPVIMTSGSAVANTMPAVVEATLRQVPLVVVSANRPWVEQNTGSSQTIDQFHMFGRHARFFTGIDAALAGSRAGQGEQDFLLPKVRSSVDRALSAAVAPGCGGAVHIDVPFVEPLVPGSSDTIAIVAQEVALARIQTDAHTELDPESPWATRAQRHTDIADMRFKYGLPFGQIDVDISKKTLVVAGDVYNKAWAAEMLEVMHAIPTIAEPSSPAPELPVHPMATSIFSQDSISDGINTVSTKPEQIIILGHPTLHRSVLGLLADPHIVKYELSESQTVTDPWGSVRVVGSTISVTGENPDNWVDITQAASQMAADAVKEVLADEESGFTGLHVAAVLADSLQDGDYLMAGASNPVRDLSMAGLPCAGVTTYSSRGAAGIDGLVSTSIGTALGHDQNNGIMSHTDRTLALLGDVTFLHDIGGLNIGDQEQRPHNLVIIVPNDNGGSIFESLEAGTPALRSASDGTAVFERVFATPTATSIQQLCDGFHIAYAQAGSMQSLKSVLEYHAAGGIDEVAENQDYYPGILVVEAHVSREQRRTNNTAIGRALGLQHD